MSLSLCLMLLMGRPLAAQAAPAVPLPHYSLAADLDMDTASLRTREVVRFTNTYGVALDSLVFKAALGAVGTLSLNAVTVDDRPVPWTFDASNSVLELSLATSLEPADATTVELDWSLQIPHSRGRLGVVDNIIGLGNWFPTLSVHHGAWDRRPYTDIGDPFFTEVADYDVQLDLSRPATVAFTGDLVQQDGTHWQLSARSVRDMALAVSSDYQRLDVQIDNGPLVSVYALDLSRGQAELDAARTYVEAYAALVGPYPLASLRVAETGLQPEFAGMEYPGLVFVSSGFGARASTAMLHGVVAHEVAHQWFYALLGDDEFADAWLDEAFATYVADEASESAPAQLSGVAGNTLSGTDNGPPVDQGVAAFQDNGPYAVAVYQRGSRFLADLRRTMGDTAWTAFLRSLYATYADKVETPRAVLDLAQQAAPGSDLGPIVDEYTRYFGSDVPVRSDWSVGVPDGAWSGQVSVDVEAAFPLASIELWLDDRQIASATSTGVMPIDASPMPAGDYVLLARVTDAQGTTYERAQRVTVGS